MISFPLKVEPRGSLYIGGYAQSAGDSDGDSASDRQGLLIPGSAVKGALREAALRLVNGAGRGQDLVDRLFGREPRDGEPVSRAQPGILRVGQLRGTMGVGLAARNHVSLDRQLRQAAPQRLFQNSVTLGGVELAFEGELTATRALTADEEGLLRSAALLADQIGGGRGRGLGWVEVKLGEASTAEPAKQLRAGEQASDLRTMILELRALEPLQLGQIKDQTNLKGSLGHLPGSMVRGAVAAALAGEGPELLEELFGGAAPVLFGDGYPGDASAIPAPLTLTEAKGGGVLLDDALLRCAERERRDFDRRSVRGAVVRSAEGTWSRAGVRSRLVTRTARDLAAGRGLDGRLFTLEVLDPSGVLPEDPLRFFVPVQGKASQLKVVTAAARRGLLVGGSRSRGFGRLALDACHAQPLDPVAVRHGNWVAAATALGVDNPAATGSLLALGPLVVDGARLRARLAEHHLELIGGVVRRHLEGGWISGLHLPRRLAGALVPGSVLIVRHRHGEPATAALEALEAQGIGPGRADGWGRVFACHAIHLECQKKEDRT